ncbi:MAG: hypothetical protein WC426_14270 [Sulfuriferula sp.]
MPTDANQIEWLTEQLIIDYLQPSLTGIAIVHGFDSQTEIVLPSASVEVASVDEAYTNTGIYIVKLQIQALTSRYVDKDGSGVAALAGTIRAAMQQQHLNVALTTLSTTASIHGIKLATAKSLEDGDHRLWTQDVDLTLSPTKV